MKNYLVLIRFIAIATVLLSACQSTQVLPPSTTTLPETTPAVEPSPTAVILPVVAEPDPDQSQDPQLPEVAPVRSGDPMQFTFPTPAPIPASRWRPPLYDVPWALGPNDHFFLTRPINADEVNWPEWDYRYGAVAEGKKLAHSGIDIAANRNTPVVAAGPGVVTWAGYGLINRREENIEDPYGLAVQVEHDFGFDGHRVVTVYGHLARVDVVKGQHVASGQQLGIVGTTGNSTGPHLHFEVRLLYGDYGATRNPELWLSPPQGWGVLVARLMREDTTPLYQKAVFVRSKATNHIWEVRTYGPNNIYFDDYYRENLVLSDLPAGDYEVSFVYNEELKKADVSIRPGGITYFMYREGRGFSNDLPGTTPAPTDWLVTPKSP
jgi:hypothetical protein